MRMRPSCTRSRSRGRNPRTQANHQHSHHDPPCAQHLLTYLRYLLTYLLTYRSIPRLAFRIYAAHAERGVGRRATAPRVEVPMRVRLALVCALMPLRTAGTQRWTQSGCECQLPFAYRSIVFHTCTELEWTGHPW